MVFAIAALFLQLTPGMSAVPPASGEQALSSVSEPSVANNTPAATGPADRSGTSSDSSNSAHFNIDKVSLASTSSGNTTPKLTAVSLESTSNSDALSTIRVPELNPGKPVGVTAAENKPYKREWLTLMVVEHGAAAFDAYSTRQAVSRGAVEDDPLMRPFAHSGLMYAATQVGPVAFDLLARHMLHSENGFVRKMWWMPQSVSAATSIFAGVHNLNVASRQ
ncbi:MAG: hypothetical protein WB780_18910 [Candidatus Acidiferrales bacterium]